MAEPIRSSELPDWPEQELRGHRIEGYRYTSKEIMDLEMEHMWHKIWICLLNTSPIQRD